MKRNAEESVQKAVYELSKTWQAIDGEDFGLATFVLGSTDGGWIREVKAAISKAMNWFRESCMYETPQTLQYVPAYAVNRNAEEEGEAANFSAALQALQSAVSKQDSSYQKVHLWLQQMPLRSGLL